MGWIKALSSLFSIVETVFAMMRDKRLRQEGYAKAKAEVESRKVKNNEITKEIDATPDSTDPWNKL